MEYKYQIGEIVYDQHAACVITAHGVYQDGDVAVPYYQATSVTVQLGTRSLPLTDERIHRDEYMKQWYREGLLSGVDEYYEDRVKHFEERKQLLEQDIQVVEEKIKRFKDLLDQGKEEVAKDVSKTQEEFSSRKYVVRVTTPHEDKFWYIAKNAPLGSSLSHESRKVFDTLSEAWQVQSAYNNQAYRCHAVVVPDGTEEYCRNAQPVEVNSEE